MKALTAILLIFLMPMAFAAGWEGTAAAAIMASAGFIGVLYMAGMGFGVNELQIIAKEEYYQLFATAILIALLFGSSSIMDGISDAFSDGTSPTLQAHGLAVIDKTLNTGPDSMIQIYNNITELDTQVASEGSKTLSCSILQIGYTVSACGGYSMVNTPLSMAGGITGFAIGELYSMRRLILISTQFAMNLLLPIGILLRTFKLTRGAGGFLMATAVSMYILLPAGMVFNDMLAETFLAEAGSSAYTGGIATSVPECDPDAVIFDSESGATSLLDSLLVDLRKVVFSVLVRGTLGPVMSLMIMAAGIRALSSLGGAEVDVSALGRLV